jgi:hypothetical protein
LARSGSCANGDVAVGSQPGFTLLDQVLSAIHRAGDPHGHLLALIIGTDTLADISVGSGMSLFRLGAVSAAFLTLILSSMGLASPRSVHLKFAGSDFQHGATTPICDRLFKSSPSDVTKALTSQARLQRQLSILTNFQWNTGDTVAFIDVCKYGIADFSWLQPSTDLLVHGEVVREMIWDISTTSIPRRKLISLHWVHVEEIQLSDVTLDEISLTNVTIDGFFILERVNIKALLIAFTTYHRGSSRCPR